MSDIHENFNIDKSKLEPFDISNPTEPIAKRPIGRIILALLTVAMLMPAFSGIARAISHEPAEAEPTELTLENTEDATDINELAALADYFADKNVLSTENLPTAGAFTSLDGSDLVTALTFAGFSFDPVQYSFVNEDATSVLMAGASDALYDVTDLLAMPEGAGNQPVFYMLSTTAYKNVPEIFEKLIAPSVTIEDSSLIETVGFAVVSTAGREYFIEALSANGESTLLLFNSAGLRAGALDNLVGYHVGNTPQECFDNIMNGTIDTTPIVDESAVEATVDSADERAPETTADATKNTTENTSANANN